MKGKGIIVFCSLLLFAMAIYLYVTRPNTNITVRSDLESPKISMLSYEYYRFKDDLVVSRLAGEKAELFDGGRLEMTDGVRAVRINSQRREELSARRADLQLISSNLGNPTNMDKVDKIRVRESVDLMIGEAHLETEDAVYTEADTTIRSEVPVRMEQNGNFLAGEHGFEFNTKQESIKMKGGITGTLIPSTVRSSGSTRNTPSKGTKK